VRYVVRAFIGLTLMLGSSVCAAYAVYQFLQIGSCGDSSQGQGPCPPGTWRVFVLLFAGIILALVGLAIYATRGDPPGSEGHRHARGGVIMWIGIFGGIAFASIYGVVGPNSDPSSGAQIAGWVLGGVFGLMALAALPGLFGSGSVSSGSGWQMVSGVGTGIKMMNQWRQGAGASSGDDVQRLERASKLYAEGAISKQEFDELKSKILEDKDE
jgi:hypothetical protein